jgi:hypothetical protein
MQHGMFYMHRREQSDGQESVFETAHQPVQTDACKTYHIAYKTVSLRMNPRGLVHVGDIRN